MHNSRNNRETVIIPQTIIVPTKSIIVASLAEVMLLSSGYMSIEAYKLTSLKLAKQIFK